MKIRNLHELIQSLPRDQAVWIVVSGTVSAMVLVLIFREPWERLLIAGGFVSYLYVVASIASKISSKKTPTIPSAKLMTGRRRGISTLLILGWLIFGRQLLTHLENRLGLSYFSSAGRSEVFILNSIIFISILLLLSWPLIRRNFGKKDQKES